MSRTKLAWVAKVERLDDIPGKDLIKYASLAGTQWQVIVNPSMLGICVGGLVAYVEYDSYLPAAEKIEATGRPNPFEFLRKNSFSPRRDAFKVRPMRMAGLVSYGLASSLSIVEAYGKNVSDFKEGDDLTELLGARSVDEFPELDGSGEKWAFPPRLSKTDEVRIEALSNSVYEELRGQEFIATMKLDGQSTTYAIIGGDFYVASRNFTRYRKPVDEAIEELVPQNKDRFADGAVKYAASIALAKSMKGLDRGDCAIQGELVGPGVQKNKLGLPCLCVYAFNFIDLAESTTRYKAYDEMTAIVATMYGLPVVPEVWRGKFNFSNKAELKKLAEVTYPNGSDGEGIVLRALDENLLNEPFRGVGPMRSFKVINDAYLV